MISLMKVFLPLLLALTTLALPAAQERSRPNILFILSDDHRFDGLGAAGNAEIKTPQLDALAASGVHFTHATVAVPQCSPSRATLLTGLLPHQHGYYSNKNWTREADKGFKADTAVELLRAGGYDTALIGKWHLEPEPWKCGFSETRLWMPQGSDEYIDPKLARGRSAKIDTVKGHVTELFSDDAIKFLRGRNEQRAPFFLWLAYTAPHTPQKPVPARIEAQYADFPRQHRPPGFPPDQDKPGPWKQYYGAITHLDEQVGRVLRQLKESGLDGNTVVIFLGDNGWLMGSHGVHGKIVPGDESIRVPLIISAPPEIARWRGASSALVSSLDLPATWLEIAGREIPREWPGQSLLPLLRDKSAHFRDFAICEFEDEEAWPGQAYRLLRTVDWKYILRPPRSEKDERKLGKKFKKMEQEKKNRKAPPLAHEQLFDLRRDPHEFKDVSAGDPPELSELRERLQEQLKATHDPALRWYDEDFRMEGGKTRERREDDDSDPYK